MFVDDEDYMAAIMSTLREERCCIEYAVQQAGVQFAEMFVNMDDAYMKAETPLPCIRIIAVSPFDHIASGTASRVRRARPRRV